MLVVTEVTYLLGTRLGTEAEARFLGDLASGNLIAEAVAASDWLRIAELTATYGNLPLGTVDASMVAAGERLGISQLATLDLRHSPWSGRHMLMRSNCCLDGPRISIGLQVPGSPTPPGR